MINFYNCDCIEYMKSIPDNYFEISICDPPYGLKNRTHTYHSPEQSQKNSLSKFKPIKWDNKMPDKQYFDELFRVSKNQIIWGGNYFNLPPTRTIICWDKMVYIPSMSQIELAWTSFDSPARLIKINNSDADRIHPTQKPVELYRWILQRYANPNDKILDTHGGSMSIAIACDMEGFDLDICEIDTEYFTDGVKRYNTYKQQLKLF